MNKTIGENLKKLRENMGYNQANIAGFLKVDQSLISKIEKGERNISADMLDKLACLFGVSIEEIEKETTEASKLTCALRASDMNLEDMEAIYAINRIALNQEFMDKLLKGELS